LSGFCGTPLPEWPYGDIFVKTIQDVFSKLYERVDLVTNRMNGEGFEAVFEAQLTGLSAKPSCPAQLNATQRAEGTLQAVDFQGAEIWRSRVHSKDLQTQGLTHETDLDREAVFAVIRALVTDWLLELESLPTDRYARRPGLERTAPVPSSQPAPPPIY